MTDMKQVLEKIVAEVKETESSNTRSAGTDYRCRQFFVEHGDELLALFAQPTEFSVTLTPTRQGFNHPDDEDKMLRDRLNAISKLTGAALEPQQEEVVADDDNAAKWRENVEAMLSSGDQDVIRCREGGGPESLIGSLVLTMMRTRNARDKALQAHHTPVQLESQTVNEPRYREPLPDRREADSITATHQWVPGDDRQDEHMVLTVGRYADGRVGEVFIDYTDKKMLKNERAKNLGHDIATLISIALQYGAPLEVLRESVGRGEIPWMGGKKRYPHTTLGTVLDVLADHAPLPEPKGWPGND